MIAPRITRLVRVPDLRALHRGLVRSCCTRRSDHTAVLVPTHTAAAELRRTIENLVLLAGGSSAVFLPDLLTRTGFYARLAERLPGLPVLTELEREVLFRLAARDAEAAGATAPFKLRPGLIAEILDFYDQLRRNGRSIDDFHRLITGDLAPAAGTDRGAERLLRQADFLAAAFAAFERRTANTGQIDEHGLRALLLESSPVPAYEHIVITVADQHADPHGLWSADFDLLARMPGVRRIDVFATERSLAAGFHQRLADHFPGIEEVREGEPSGDPVLVAPAVDPMRRPAFVHTYRDREEELAAVARSLKRAESSSVDRTAVVFQRPLPYVYLARHVFGSAHVPYEAADALPLAGEPFAAALDLIFAFIDSEASRAATVELLRSPHWRFDDPHTGTRVGSAEVAALDARFREIKYLGGWNRLRELTVDAESRAAPALRAAIAAADELADVVNGPTASEQIATLQAFIRRHECGGGETDVWHARHLRARAAILGGIESLREAHERHDDQPVTFVELAATVRRWIEGHTFAPRTGRGGLLMIDAAAAPFADVDVLRVVGLVDGDWPARSPSSVFFPARLLEQLGWPSHTDRSTAARARFHDLLHLAARRVAVSTLCLEDDAIVSASPFADDVRDAGLLVEHAVDEPCGRVFDHEALSMEPIDPVGATGDAGRWLAVRQQLASLDAPQFHGETGARPSAVYAVSRVERYLDCPFKYFAAHLLRLDEERPDDSGLTPLERGRLLHEVFETFFTEWRTGGRGAITGETLEEALAVFENVAGKHLERLPDADRALERTHLLGSAVAPGLAERAFAFEIEHGAGVLERLLEHALDGTFVFNGPDGLHRIAVKGKADRIDLLDDGTLRIIDYKIGRAPKPARSLQLAVYSACAQQQLAGRHGRQWTVSRAGYVAFREPNAFVSIGNNLERALAEGEQRFVTSVAAIEQGSFPPRPEDPWLCSRCGYATVCRKDYVGDE